MDNHVGSLTYRIVGAMSWQWRGDQSWWSGRWGDNDWWSGGWGDNDWWQDGWRDEGWWGNARASDDGRRGSTRQGDQVRGGTRPGGSHRGSSRPAQGHVRGGTRADAAASGQATAKDEPDDEYVYAVLPFSLKEDWPPNSYPAVYEEIKDMGCTISLRSRTAKKATDKQRQARVTIKGPLAQEAFALFCQRAEELIQRDINWRSVPFRQRWRDKAEKDAATSAKEEQKKEKEEQLS